MNTLWIYIYLKSSKQISTLLSPKQLKDINEFIGSSQRCVQNVIWCNFICENNFYENGLILQTEHMLIFFKTGFKGRLIFLFKIHILKIKIIKISNNNELLIKLNKHIITIWTESMTQLVKEIFRNYYIARSFFPKSRFLIIKSSEECYKTMFPKIRKFISPSQSLQFCYYALCTLENTNYIHEVAQFFHETLMFGSPIFDLNLLPIKFLDESTNYKMNLKPIFSTLKYSPFTMGVSCSDRIRPDILTNSVILFTHKNDIEFLSLRKCKIKEGAKLLAEKINFLMLKYIDLSNNPIEDIGFFTFALKDYLTELFYLDLSYCNLSDEATKNLFISISKNKKLHSLSYLNINGANITKESIKIFCEHLMKLSKNAKNNCLHYLILGKITSGSDILFKTLLESSSQLEILSVAGTKLKEKSLKSLTRFIRNASNIREVDLSRTSIDVKEIQLAIEAVNINKNIQTMVLHLNSLKLNGNKLNKVLNVFSNQQNSGSLKKWFGLSFEHNGMKVNDLKNLLCVLKRMPNLKTLNIGYNFSTSMKSLFLEIENILSIPSLEYLSLRGNSSKYLAAKDLVYFCDILISKPNRKIFLDVSGNQLNNDGICQIQRLIKNDKLFGLKMEGQKITSFETLFLLFDSILQSNLIYFKTPFKDIYSLLTKYTPKVQKGYIERISNYQKNIQQRIMLNQANNRMNFNLSLKNIPEIDNLIDNLTLRMNKLLLSSNFYFHSTINTIIGIDYPFDPTNFTSVKLNKKLILASYGIPDLFLTDPKEKQGIPTPQFMSLCLRRPGLSETRPTFRNQSRNNQTNLIQGNNDRIVVTETRDIPSISEHTQEELINEEERNESETNSCIKMSASDDFILSYFNDDDDQDEYNENSF